MTYTTDSPTSLEEQAIQKAVALMREWKRDCTCNGKFCESYGCSSLDELIAILTVEVKP